MKVNMSDLSREYTRFKNQYDFAFTDVMRKGWFILGDYVSQFESKFGSWLGAKHAVGVNSGLDALVISLTVLGIHEGDEVIVPANTFIATVLAISAVRAVPVFVEPDAFYNIDTDKIIDKISSATKAIIVVHLYGQAAQMDKLKSIASENRLYLIEDCAQSHGASFKNIKTGCWGDIACFSFYPTKNLGAFGDGGMITTNNYEFAERARLLRNYGSKVKYHFDECGFNSRLDELQAALLLVKFSHIDQIISERKRIANRYLGEISNSKVILPKTFHLSEHVYHLFVVYIENRNDFQSYLSKHEISTQIHYPIPPHLSKAYESLGYKIGDFPISELISNHVLSLPMHEWMTEEEVTYVIKVVNDYK